MFNNDYEGDFIHRALQIISEISEQLSHNHKFATSLRSQAESLKVRIGPLSTHECRMTPANAKLG
jgi:hypothetical protein